MKRLTRSALTLAMVMGLAGVAHAQIVPIWWNNLYYQNSSGYLVLTGHGSIDPTSPDYAAQVDGIAAHGVHYARVWTMCGTVPLHRPWVVHRDFDDRIWVFELGTWNDAYWADFRQALSLARDRDIVAEVHLFDRSGVGWDPDNVVHCSGGKGLFQTDYTQWFENPAQRSYLEGYVDKLITESYDFDNVIYDVDQESQVTHPAWHAYWAQFVRTKLSSLGSDPARVVAITPPGNLVGALGGWDLSAIDTINLHIGQSDPPPNPTIGQMVAFLQGERALILNTRSATDKAISIDEWGNGMSNEDQLRMMAWTFLASGAHFHIEEAADAAAFNVAGAIERWKGLSYWEFWHFAASDEPVLSGGLARSCMGGSGNQPGYLCYVPTTPQGSTGIGVTLPAPPAGFGGWAAEVWNPRNVDAGAFGPFYSSSPTFLQAGLPGSDSDAFKRDWVLAIWANAGPAYTLSVTRGGAGGGTVTSSPAGIDCGADCMENYTIGTLVSLSASPAAGSRFAGWGGDCTGTTSPCQVTMNQARSVSAVFEPLPSYPLTVTLSGGGTGSVTSWPAGINCGTDCSESYVSGTVVRLTATPGPVSAFAGWSGACSGMQATCLVTVDGPQSVTATFTPFSGLLYRPLPLPCRVYDSRGGSPWSHGSIMRVQVAGLCGIPTEAQAVAAMVGSVSPTAMGFITTSTPVPTTAITTFPWGGSAWSAWAGSGVVALSGGAVTAAAYLADAGSTHVIVDVSGFFVPADLGGQSYVPLVPPARFLDTRTTNDPLPAATERVYQTAGFGGLPATATALALSATVVVPQSYGYLNLYAADRGFPLTSFLNYLAGDVIANGGIVAVSGTTGRLAAWSVQGVHLTLDVHGAFVPETARRYYPIEPCRVLDTRVTGQRFSGSLTFAVGGTCGIPADAAAVAADFAVVNPSLFGYLALSPAGYTAYVSQLLYRPGWTISSGALVSLGTGGGVTVQSGGGGTTDFVFDVTGYFR